MNNLIIYGRNGCSKCLMAKTLLTSNNKDFTYIYIETMKDKDANEIIEKASKKGITGLPIIVFNEEIITDIREVLK